MCMTNVYQKLDGARGVFGDVKPRNEVLEQIQGSPVVYEEFLRLRPEFQERFIQFCMGVRGVQMTYDPFFIKIFDAEIHPERLSRLLSEVFVSEILKLQGSAHFSTKNGCFSAFSRPKVMLFHAGMKRMTF